MGRGKKTRKCQHCGIDDTLMEDMEFDWTEAKKPVQKWFHKGECWDAYVEERDFKRKEVKELDELRLVIQDIYGIDPLPEQAYPFLQKLRNGEPVFRGGQVMGKRYKQGYSYPLIKKTYEFCSDTIQYYSRTKDFNGFVQEFIYGLRIIVDKIYTVEQREAQLAKQEEMIENHIEQLIEQGTDNTEYEDDFVSPYKKKKKKTDMDFFD